MAARRRRGAAIAATPAPALLRPYAFVTVGTTLFDALADAVLSAPVAAAILELGIPRVVMQIGRGSPAAVPAPCLEELAAQPSTTFLAHGLEFFVYRLKPDIRADMVGAACVISHAGAGSIFEALRCSGGAGRPLVVVTNPALADNHQEELAKAMQDSGALMACTVGTLAATLRSAAATRFATLPPPDASAFVAALDAVIMAGAVPG